MGASEVVGSGAGWLAVLSVLLQCVVEVPSHLGNKQIPEVDHWSVSLPWFSHVCMHAWHNYLLGSNDYLPGFPNRHTHSCLFLWQRGGQRERERKRERVTLVTASRSLMLLAPVGGGVSPPPIPQKNGPAHNHF